ncbi:MAG: cation:proton antiporter [Rhodospirillaceae bacterium]|nr:cation:proton antiporter [Rhodospirillaceae bacterium]
MDLFYVLLILLVATRAFGEVAERLAQPALVGELTAGVALGAVVASFPGIFPTLSGLGDNEVFVTITDLGMFFLMLFAGLEMQPRKMFERSASSLGVAFGGMVVPLALGVGLGWAFLPDSPLRTAQCLFLGTALAITAVPATVRILTDLNFLDTRIGQTIVSAAVIDDVFSLMLLAWFTGMIGAEEPSGLLELAILSGKVVLFFTVTTLIGLFVFPWGGRFIHHLRVHELEISAMLVAAFAFAVLAEVLGLHFIVGAFIAGLYFGRKTINVQSYERVRNTVSGMTFGFLAPIFFASIGFELNFTSVVEIPGFLALLIACAFLGKIGGAGLMARAFGFSRNDSLVIGVGMSPRGAVELVIAGIVLKAGLLVGDSDIVRNLFSAVVIMSVVTTVLSPIILARVFAARSNHD